MNKFYDLLAILQRFHELAKIFCFVESVLIDLLSLWFEG